MDVTWKIVRSKVRNMRRVYQRAKDYEHTHAENELGANGETVRGK